MPPVSVSCFKAPTRKTLFGNKQQMLEKLIEMQQLTQKHTGVLTQHIFRVLFPKLLSDCEKL